MSVEEQKHLSCKERRLIGPPPLSFPSHKSFSRSLDSTSTSSSRTPVDCLEKQRRCGRLHSPLTACFCNRALPPSFRSYIRQYRKHSLESCSRNVPRRVAQWESRGTDPESSWKEQIRHGWGCSCRVVPVSCARAPEWRTREWHSYGDWCDRHRCS